MFLTRRQDGLPAILRKKTQLKTRSQGNLVEIPGFGNETFTVRLRKPNMLTLLKSGKIPNDLMSTAEELFASTKNGKKSYSGKELSDLCNMMEAFCEACLLNTTRNCLKAHYTQVLSSDFTDAYALEKEVQEFAQEPAGMGCFGVATEKTQITASPCISTVCNSVHKSSQDKNLHQVGWVGLEPAA